MNLRTKENIAGMEAVGAKVMEMWDAVPRPPADTPTDSEAYIKAITETNTYRKVVDAIGELMYG